MSVTRKSNPRKGPKRKYNTWSTEETSLFIHGLTHYQRDFTRISATVGTKDYSQTRDYFYRLLKGVRAALGTPWDKEVLAANIEEVTVLVRAFTNYKAQGRTLRVMKDDMVEILTSYRKDKTQPRTPPPQDTRNRSNSASQINYLRPEPVPKRSRSNPEVEVPYPTSVEHLEVLDSSPVECHESSLHKCTLMLYPHSALIESFLRAADLNPHLALSVKRTKKLCSIVTYLEKKWCAGLPADRRISIRLRENQVSSARSRDNMGTAFTPATVQLGGFLQSLGVHEDTTQFSLEYDFFPVSGAYTLAVAFPPQNASSLPPPLLHGGVERQSNWTLPLPEGRLQTSHGDKGSESFGLVPFEDNSSLEWYKSTTPRFGEYQAPMVEPPKTRPPNFNSGSLFPSLEFGNSPLDDYSSFPRPSSGSMAYIDFGEEPSRDGFESNQDPNNYEQRCRLVWNEQERSLDYPPYYPPYAMSPTPKHPI